MTAALLIALAGLAMAAYMAPVMIAARRRHPYAWSILVLTLFGGWTFFFWVAALAWAVGPIRREPWRADHLPHLAPPPMPHRPAGHNVVKLDDFRPVAP